jgi:hypothetical protein
MMAMPPTTLSKLSSSSREGSGAMESKWTFGGSLAFTVYPAYECHFILSPAGWLAALVYGRAPKPGLNPLGAGLGTQPPRGHDCVHHHAHRLAMACGRGPRGRVP